MKSIIKAVAGILKIDAYERLLTYSILKYEFPSINLCPTYKNREELWSMVLSSHSNSKDKITYVEFGVFEGYSINFFSKYNKNNESIFLGLDSFEGLPENWGAIPQGTFNVGGVMPYTEDSRVTFIKGWFQHTWTILYSKLTITPINNLIVHYDADLYSSTLFALTKIDSLNKSYIAIFDEFTGHETRALYSYCQAYNAKVEFLGKTLSNKFPNQVACQITPTSVLKN